MKKLIVLLVAVVLLITSIPVLGEPAKEGLVWNTLEVTLDTGLENLEYNGTVYVGYKGSDVYYSKDSRDWEKVFSVKAKDNSSVTLSDVYRIGDGSAFLLQDSTGQYYISADGVEWVKASKEEPIKNSVRVEYMEGKIYQVKDGVTTKYSVGHMSNVQRVKLINDKLVVFAADSDNSSKNVLYYAPLGETSNKVRVKGKALDLDVEPQLVNDRILVPFRAIVEALGGEVSWDEATQTVTAKKGDKVVTLQIDNVIAKVDGVEFRLEVPAKLINNRTLIPVRFVSESLGANVAWDYLENTAIVDEEVQPTKPAPVVPAPGVPAPVVVPGNGGAVGGDNGAAAREQLKNEIISRYTAEAQGLQSESQAQLASIESRAKSEYYALPVEKRAGQKMTIASKYIDEALQIGIQMDAKFTDITQRMSAELVSNNFTTEAVQQAQAQYQQLKDATYMSYMNMLK